MEGLENGAVDALLDNDLWREVKVSDEELRKIPLG